MSQSLWQRLFNHRQQTKQAVLILGVAVPEHR